MGDWLKICPHLECSADQVLLSLVRAQTGDTLNLNTMIALVLKGPHRQGNATFSEERGGACSLPRWKEAMQSTKGWGAMQSSRPRGRVVCQRWERSADQVRLRQVRAQT